MKAHRCVVFALLLGLIFAANARAGGAYQRTEDRKKTLVWNNDPQPGDAATWSGDRDSEGYATGQGKLTWSRLNRGFSTGSNVATTRKLTPLGTYSGTMERGKFTGPVTTMDHGKVYHAKFVDGQRQGNWAAGPAKADSTEAGVVAEKPKRTEPAQTTAVATESTASAKISTEKKESQVTTEATEDIPAAGPEEKPQVTSQSSEVSKSTSTQSTKPATPLIAQASTEADESATPRQPVTRKGALAPGAVRAIDRPTSGPTKKNEAASAKQSTRTKTSEPKPEKAAKSTPSESAELETQTSDETPAEGPATVAKEEMPSPPALHTSPITSQPAQADKPVDSSLRTLTGPPSSLHVKTPASDTTASTQSATTTAPTAAPAPSVAAPASPKLTAVQAMDIADIEARTRGYDLGDYELPKADYNAANDTWAVAYAGRSADGSAKKFSVTVQDKTGKAEVKK